MKRIIAILTLILTFILLFDYSQGRHFQPDEFIVTNSINSINFPVGERHLTLLNFYMLPLSLIIKNFELSKNIYFFLRATWFSLFLLNIYILYLLFYNIAKKESLLILSFLLTQATLWRFGLEIRHELFVVLGFSLSSFLFFRFSDNLHSGNNRNSDAYLLAAALTFLAQSCFKGILYSVGLLGIILSCLWVVSKRDKRIKKNVFHLLQGFFIFNVLIVFCFILFGVFDDYLDVIKHYLNSTNTSIRFSSIPIYKYFLSSSPIMAIALISGGFLTIRNALKSKDEVNIKELYSFCSLIMVIILLLINPAPFQYNIYTLGVTCLIFLLSIYPRLPLIQKKVYITVLLLNHLIFFFVSMFNDPYMHFSNAQQIAYMDAAEKLTSKASGTILDAMGIVVTRKHPNKHWFLYNAMMNDYYNGKLTFFADIIKNDIPVVAITNYRWIWLRPEDIASLNQNYIRLGQDFWVLGRELRDFDDTLTIRKDGFYLFSHKNLEINGKKILKGKVFLNKGKYSIKLINKNKNIIMTWIGESLEELPSLKNFPSQNLVIGPL